MNYKGFFTRTVAPPTLLASAGSTLSLHVDTRYSQAFYSVWRWHRDQLFVSATLRSDSAFQCYSASCQFCEGGVMTIPAWHFSLHSIISERELTFAICYRPSVCRLSVCNARAPYSGRWNFRQYFYGIWYLRHPLTSKKILRRSSQGNSSVGELNTRRVEI